MSKTKKIISVVLALALVMAMATVAIVSSSALEDGEMHVVAGAAELCGSAWDPADTNNQMTFNADKGVYEKVYENVLASTYEFKVTTNGAWDVADFNLEGDAKFGGANASVTVDVDGSTVIIGFDGEKATVEVVPAEVEETTAAPVVDETTAAPVVDETTAAPVVDETTAAPVVDETTAAPVATDATEATVDETPAATDATEATTDEVETTAAVVETTAADPAETTAAVETTVAEVETTAAAVETTVAEVETTAAAKADAIVVGGVEYVAQVGDIITYTANLTTPKNIENVQAYTTYDSAKLKLVEADAATRFPNMTGVVANAADGVVYFNASEISTGFDFTAGQTLIYLQFEVIDASYSEITTVIEEMVEFFGGDYVTGGEIVADGVALVEALEVPVVEETTTTTVVEDITTTAIATDATSATEDEQKPADVVPTGVAATIYVVLAVLAMAAAAVVVLRKKVNG